MSKILFLSALDFKEKSIQVIRKTPEAYSKAGWNVDYLVARDNVSNGNYFYEEEINPDGVDVYRFYWPLSKARALSNRYVALLISKVASFWVIFKLFLKAKKLLKGETYDVIYGYELQGVLAMNLLKPFLPKKTKTISRFQGTFLNEMFEGGQYFRLFFNLDLIVAIRAKSDLLIMTNDGTQGDKALKKIKGENNDEVVFWVNGVDFLPKGLKPRLNKDNKIILLSVSRLVGWKRVERNFEICSELMNLGFINFKYYVVGEGEQRSYLERLALEKNIENNVFFVGAVKHEDVIAYQLSADFFLSMYDSSNVGNPLLEAMRANNLIVTLANGDTGKWIEHKCNGLIYEPDDIDYKEIAKDIFDIVNDQKLLEGIKSRLRLTENEKLLSWDQRMKNEVYLAENL